MHVKHDISAEVAEGIINQYVTQQVDWSAIQGIRLLGLDEIALKKGHQDFLVIVSAIDIEDHKRILAVLPVRLFQHIWLDIEGRRLFGFA